MTHIHDNDVMIDSGKELVRLLKASGTGDVKLNVARAALRADPKATSRNVLAALEASEHVWEGTVAKAVSIITTGEPIPPEKPKVDPEDEPDEPPVKGWKV